MNECNGKLAKSLNFGKSPKLAELGFKCNESEIDVDWRIENDKFCLLIDMYFEVKLYRKNPDSDAIVLLIETVTELKEAVTWIED